MITQLNLEKEIVDDDFKLRVLPRSHIEGIRGRWVV